MKNIFSKINELFTEEQLEDDSINNDDLWDSICKELDESSEKRWFSYFSLQSVLLYCFLGAVIVTYMFINSYDKPIMENKMENGNLSYRKEIISNDSKNNETKINITSVDDVNIENKKVDNSYKITLRQGIQKEIDMVSIHKGNKSKKGTLKQSNFDNDNETTSIRTELTLNSNFPAINNISNAKTDIRLLNNDVEVLNNSLINISNDDTQESGTQVRDSNLILTDRASIWIEKLNYIQKELLSNSNHSISWPSLTSSFTKENNEFDRSPFRVMISSSINKCDINYTTDNTEFDKILNDTEESYWGNSVGVHFSKDIFINWEIGSGIIYNDLWSKFNYTLVDSTWSIKSNQLIKIQIDRNTLDTLNFVYGDGNVLTKKSRNIQHHNNHKILSIPLQIGYKRIVGKFEYGLILGTAFNFRLESKGRTINELGEVVSLESYPNTMGFSKYSLSLHFEPFLNYNLYKNIMVRLSVQMASQSYQINKDKNLRMNIKQYGCRLSLGYNF